MKNFDDVGALRDNALRKAEFADVARNLAYWNRNAAKFYQRFDLTAEIKKALEAAYQAGLANGSAPAPSPSLVVDEEAGIAWALLPAQSRSPFDLICRHGWVVLFYENAAAWKADPNQWVCFHDRGEEIQGEDRLAYICAYSPRTLAPLVKLGLMEEVDLPRGHRMLEVTQKGGATFEAAILRGQIHPID